MSNEMEFGSSNDNSIFTNESLQAEYNSLAHLSMLDIKSIRQGINNQINILSEQAARNEEHGLSHEADLFRKYEGGLASWRERLDDHVSDSVVDCENQEDARLVPLPGPRPVEGTRPSRRFHFPLPPWQMSLAVNACCIFVAVFITYTLTGFEVNVSGDRESIVTFSEPVQIDRTLPEKNIDFVIAATTHTTDRDEAVKQVKEIPNRVLYLHSPNIHADPRKNIANALEKAETDNTLFLRSGKYRDTSTTWIQSRLRHTGIYYYLTDEGVLVHFEKTGESMYIGTSNNKSNNLPRNIRSSSSHTIVNPTEVFTSTPTTIQNAYLPGQVRIGTRWNRFGNKEGSQGEDWPRVLAHELGHYLFFQLDNYLGISENGLLTEVDCSNSVMTDPYVEAYSEFLSEWTDDCLSTVAYKTTGRYDWETIRNFYPMLQEPDSKNGGPNLGPTSLPLAVTQIQFIEPPTSTRTLASPFFRITDATGQPLILDDGKTQRTLLR